MDSDCSALKLHGRIQEGAISMEGIPSEVDGGVSHGVVCDEGIGGSLDDGGEAVGDAGLGNLIHPFITDGKASTLICDIDIGASPEAVLFGFDGVENHLLALEEGGGVDTADHELVMVGRICGGDFFIEKLVRDGAAEGDGLNSEEGEFGINCGFIVLSEAGFFFLCGEGEFCSFDPEGDASHDSEAADLTLRGHSDSAAVLAHGPPILFDEGGAERAADGAVIGRPIYRFVFYGGNSDEVFLGDVTEVSIDFGELFRFRDVPVIDDGDFVGA